MIQIAVAMVAGMISISSHGGEEASPGYILQTEALDQLEAAYAFDVTKEIPKRDLYLIHVDGTDDVEAMMADERVEVMSYNSTLSLADDRTPGFESVFDWQEAMMGLTGFRDDERTEEVLTVAVLDTGIFEDPSIRDQLLDPVVIRGGYTPSPDSHGSLMARIVAEGNAAAQILPVQVLDEEGVGTVLDFVEGMYEAVDADVDVINLSLAARQGSIVMEFVTNAAVEAGIPVIAASGNSGREHLAYPAAYEASLAVGAVDEDGLRYDFSQYGEGLDVMAPGSARVGVWSTRGTSIAAAFTSRALTVLAAGYPDQPLMQHVEVLKETAIDQGPGSGDKYGLGIINIHEAARAQERIRHMAMTESFLGETLERTICDPVTFAFNAEVDEASVEDGVEVYNALGTEVEAQWRVEGDTLIMTVTEPGVRYVFVNDGLTDTGGEPLTEEAFQEMIFAACEDES